PLALHDALPISDTPSARPPTPCGANSHAPRSHRTPTARRAARIVRSRGSTECRSGRRGCGADSPCVSGRRRAEPTVLHRLALEALHFSLIRAEIWRVSREAGEGIDHLELPVDDLPML